MTVEEIPESSSSGAGSGGDQFPVGMRVLAVDDSRACLKVLETLLRRCQYHVTTTNQAVSALKLLRENKDEFDIVISDVHMPNMDGFKLLELVGLEMDLPVIMLSANDDTKSVMKGITHGACDYLVKPVRIKELKNIWQHVIRRRKFDNRGPSNCHRSCGAKSNQANTDAGEDQVTSGLPDWNERLNRKRKDQYLEEEYDSEENGQENEDASTQKKQRVIWTGALHRKFVDAVNLLGIDKAVPKKILELMAGENITRENVASHLQKYRQLLKKISTATSQQANVVAFGGKESSNIPRASLDGLWNYWEFAGYGQLPTLASIQQGGRLRSLNSATSFVFPGLASCGIVQQDHAHKNPNIPTDFRTSPCISLSRIQQANLGQGMPAFETNQLQQCKPMLESNNTFTNSLFDVKFPPGNSNYSFFDATNNRQLLEQQQKERNGIGINTFDRLTPLCSDSLGMNTGISSHLPDLGEYTETWRGADCLVNNFPSLENLPHFIPPASDVGCNLASSNSAVASLLSDPTTGTDLQTQANPFSDKALNIPISTYKRQLSDVGNIGNSNQRPDQIHKPNFAFNYSSNCLLPNDGLMDAVNQCGRFRSGVSNHKASCNMTDQLNFSGTFFKQNYNVEKSTAYGQTKFMDDYLLEPTNFSGYSSNAYNSFENLLGALVKQDRESISLDGDNGSDSLFN